MGAGPPAGPLAMMPPDLAPTEIVTAHGPCVVVALPDDAVEAAAAHLPAAERALAARLTPARRRDLVAGRTALRAALARHAPDLAGAPVLPDDRGAPALPAGWVGSLSHKGGHAAALIAPADGARVGLDLERAAAPRRDIAARILTADERARLAARGLSPEALGRAATLRFSIKEAIYKAIDPFVRRYVAFTEVELDVTDDGGARVATALPFAIEVTWREHAGFWLSTARARPR